MALLVADGDGGHKYHAAGSTAAVKPGPYVVTTGTTSQAGQPFHGQVGPIIPEVAKCEVGGTHEASGGASIRYADGVVISYCKFCQVRIEFPNLPGGPGAVELREMAVELLVNSADPATVDLFMQRIEQLQQERGALEDALNEAEAVLAVVAKRKLAFQDH